MSEPLTLRTLLRMARDTVSDPRAGASEVLTLGLPQHAIYLAFALVVVLSLLLGEIVTLLTGLPESGVLTGVYRTAPVLGTMQAAFLLGMAAAIARIGQMFGGVGRFHQALLLVVWLQFIFICVQVIQIAALLLVPPVAGIITVLSLGLFFWLLINFIAVMHGFTSLGTVFVMTIMSTLAILFALSIVLAILGVTFETRTF